MPEEQRPPENMALVHRGEVQHTLVRSLDVDSVVQMFEQLQEIKKKLLVGPRDTMYIGKDGRPVSPNTPGAMMYTCRAGWTKIATCFNVSFNLSDPQISHPDADRPDFYIVKTYCSAQLPNGRFQDAWGVATSDDPFFTHGGKVKADMADVILKSQTVAQNRATSNLFGGELTAEEMLGKGETGYSEATERAEPVEINPDHVYPGRIIEMQVKDEPDGKGGKRKQTRAVILLNNKVKCAGFVHEKDKEIFKAAVEGGHTIQKLGDAKDRRVAVKIKQEGKYINVAEWMPWNEQYFMDMPFGDGEPEPPPEPPDDELDCLCQNIEATIKAMPLDRQPAWMKRYEKHMLEHPGNLAATKEFQQQLMAFGNPIEQQWDAIKRNNIKILKKDMP